MKSPQQQTKIHKISLDTNIERSVQTSNTNFRRNIRSDITLVEKKKAHKARTFWYCGLPVIYQYQIKKEQFFYKTGMDRNRERES